MKKGIFSFITLLFISLTSFANSGVDAILGEWLSQEKDGKIIIFKQGDQYFGKISWGKTPGKKDTNNPDEKLRNRELVGAVILKNFKFTGSAWENGTIYDPKSGKTYDCILKVKDGNKTLDIRGFVGTPMFGRTSTWSRI
ncbi:DUF2147 domain-containing protein [Aquirufa sp. 2-AUSEE-184A6]|uniref:DUF2147 domain-containing protein n=1 Tax=Aquirufa novilacunae TaxID=3139305 RepID=A0ABW8T0M0_9BACT